MELALPKLRAGSYFPDWLLERRRRSEQALVTAVATSYLLGVSTRRMERLVAPGRSLPTTPPLRPARSTMNGGVWDRLQFPALPADPCWAL